MTTVSVIMALLALGVTVPTFVWCRKLRESVTRLKANLHDADAGDRLGELENESRSLHTRVDHLRQNWQADTTRLDAAIQQLESRVVELEQSQRSLATVSNDLEGLRDFRVQVERIRAGILKAFNGSLPRTSSTVLRDDGPPQAGK